MRIIRVPTAKELAPTERQQQALRDLFAWEKFSRKKGLVLGVPSTYDPDKEP